MAIEIRGRNDRGFVKVEARPIGPGECVFAEHPATAPPLGRFAPRLHSSLVDDDDTEQVPTIVAIADGELAGPHAQGERGERALGRVVILGHPLWPAGERLARRRATSRGKNRSQSASAASGSPIWSWRKKRVTEPEADPGASSMSTTCDSL